jgi:hypothetical protein
MTDNDLHLDFERGSTSNAYENRGWENEMRGILAALALAATSVGACSSITETGQDFSEISANHIRVGKTNKATVENNLGSPQSRETLANGEELWTYEFNRTISIFDPMRLVSNTEMIGETISRNEYKILLISFRHNTVVSCKLNIYARGDSSFYGTDRQILKDANCGKKLMSIIAR